ncbi:MAG TPA: amidohydrolase [Vicinamibacterales bacterium]|nr:amidohydrolase [Vicinamibacterales bacterium]
MKVAVVSLLALVVLAQATPPAPDLILHHGRIYTVDRRDTEVEAIAIQGDRIVRLGADADVLRLRAASTRVIDLGGAAVLPGLHDSHGHFTGLGAFLQTLNLRGTTSYQQIVDLVRQRVARARPGEWILGRAWDQNDWADTRFPTHEALSVVSPANPVYLTRVDGHAGLANAAAMTLAGLTSATPDPQGGQIIRGTGNAPTGVLVDNAQALVTSRIPPVTTAQLDEQILLADREMQRLGITTVHDAGTDGRTVDAYKRLIDAGRVKTRLYVMLRGSLPSLQPFFDKGPVVDDAHHRLAVRAIKIIADGALGSRGAAMLEPYSDEPGSVGLLTTPPEEIYAQTLAASKAGFQTAVHAIGDRANHLVLDIFERVQREVPGARALRMRVEHAQILDAKDIPRFAALGVIASMQATHATSDMPWVPARLGSERMEEGAYVWRKLIASGATIANGSDFPVEEPDPMRGLYAAVTRQDASGRPPGGWMPDQRMTRQEALASFTRNAAFASHAETMTGSLEAGKLADLVVLTRDVMDIPAPDILKTTVRMTVVGGEIVYETRAR